MDHNEMLIRVEQINLAVKAIFDNQEAPSEALPTLLKERNELLTALLTLTAMRGEQYASYWKEQSDLYQLWLSQARRRQTLVAQQMRKASQGKKGTKQYQQIADTK